MKKLSMILGGAILGLMVMLPLAQAAEFLAPGEADNGNVTVTAADTHRNLYLAGGNVTVDGKTTGDLYAAGGTIVIGGEVEQDLVVAGGNIVLNNSVGGDVRVFGGSINITRPIAGDLIVFGGNVLIGEQGSVGGDLIACGGTVTVNGAVAGSVWSNGGAITLNSKVNGPVKVRANQQLIFGSKAEVAGAIIYYGPKPAVVQDGARVSIIEYHEQSGKHAGGALAGLITLGFVLKLLAWLAAALVLIHFLPQRLNTVVQSMRQKPWKNLGIGLAAAILIPIIAIILVLTLVGYYVAFLLFVLYVFFLGLSCLTASIFLGALLIKLLMKKPDLVLDWQAAIIGVVIFSLLGLIPVIGWLIATLLSLMAFGGYVLWAWGISKKEQSNS